MVSNRTVGCFLIQVFFLLVYIGSDDTGSAWKTLFFHFITGVDRQKLLWKSAGISGRIGANRRRGKSQNFLQPDRAAVQAGAGDHHPVYRGWTLEWVFQRNGLYHLDRAKDPAAVFAGYHRGRRQRFERRPVDEHAGRKRPRSDYYRFYGPNSVRLPLCAKVFYEGNFDWFCQGIRVGNNCFWILGTM